MSEDTSDRSPSPGFASEAERLARHLVRSRGMFSLVFVRWNHQGQEDEVLAAIRRHDAGLKLASVDVGAQPDQLLAALEAASSEADQPDGLFVAGLHRAFPDFLHFREDDRPPILKILNLQREAWRYRLSTAIVLLLPEHALGLIARGAPDFWSWRSGVFDFELPAVSRQMSVTEMRQTFSTGSIIPREEVKERIARLVGLWQDIDTADDIPPREWDTASDIARQLRELYQRTGEFSLTEDWRDKALQILMNEDPDASAVHRARSNVHAGVLWNERPLGNRAKNLSKALACYNSALEVYTEADFPQEWARTQHNLGNAYWNLPTGDRGENLRLAIQCYEAALRIRTENDFPQEWAGTQNNLANAYSDLPTGDRGANLRLAIQCYEAALRIRTVNDFPQEWAMTQNNLGLAYSDLPTGDRGANLRLAIQCYEVALRIYTEDDFPQDWAMTQNNLGDAYSDLPTGDQGANLRLAIECYEAALRICTENDFPQEWARTQNNLGLAYSDLPTGDRVENLRLAIECYESALRIHTENDFPQDWAMTQNNLGAAYRNLPTGDRVENQRLAIECYESALRIHTENDFPQDWAIAQYNLGLAYLDGAKQGEMPDGRQQARTAFTNAERGYRACGLEKDAAKARAKVDALDTETDREPSD